MKTFTQDQALAMVETLQAISGGNTMQGVPDFTHMDVVIKYQEMARLTLIEVGHD